MVYARSFLNNQLYQLISTGYYFDAVYDKVLSGVMGLSHFAYRVVETSGIQRFPYVVTGGASRIAHGTHDYIEEFLDSFVYIIAGGAVETTRIAHEYIDTFLDKLVYLFAG